MGFHGLLLHGLEGAALSDLFYLILRQAEAEEAADVTDTGGEILRDKKQVEVNFFIEPLSEWRRVTSLPPSTCFRSS